MPEIQQNRDPHTLHPFTPIQLSCDASLYGVSEVLLHVMPSGEERPNAFAAMTLNSAESNDAQIERETLAIVFAVKKFHQYLFGHRFTLLTDHLPLSSGTKPAFPHCRQITCSALLCCYWHISTTSKIGDLSSTVMQMDYPGCLCWTHHQNVLKLAYFPSKKCKVHQTLWLK